MPPDDYIAAVDVAGAAQFPPRLWLTKVAAVCVALLLYEATQAATLLHVAPLLFSKQLLTTYAWIGVYEHHLWQLIVALFFITIFGRGKYVEWGLNLCNASLSWRILWRFCLIYSPIGVAAVLVPALLWHDIDLGIFAPPSAANIAGWLSFEWLFVGISEEVVFRGLIQTYLTQSWAGSLRIRRLTVSQAGLITTLVFCLAHINPLHPHIHWEQQLFAFGLGLYYSEVRCRTGSLFNPILAHNFGDGLIVTAQYFVSLHLR